MKQFGIIAALPAEAKCLAKSTDIRKALSSPLQLADNVFLIISGIGTEQAEKAAKALIQHGADALLSWGCAGALSEVLQPGDVVLPHTIMHQTSGALQTDKAWHAYLSGLLSQLFSGQYPGSGKIVTDTLAGSAQIITEPLQKQVLYQSGGAVAVDMESASIALIAQDAGVPFMAVRAIADDVNTGIPDYINKAMDNYGHINITRMLGLLLMHPASWRRLMRLGRQFSVAKASLSRINEKVGVDGLLPPPVLKKTLSD